MSTPYIKLVLAGGAAVVVVGGALTGCAATETPDAEGTTSVCVAYSDAPTVKDIPTLMAFEALKDDGVTVELQQFASGDEAVQALVAGRCDVGFNGSFGAVLAANEAGASLRVIGSGTENEFSLVSAESITSIDELEGARYGVYSELSYDKAMGQVFASENDLTLNFVVSGGSDVRGPALIAGNLDATGLDAATIVVLEEQDAGDFNVLESYADAIPGLLTNTVYTTQQEVEEKGDAISTIMDAVTASYAQNAGDADALKAAGAELIDGWDAAIDDKIVEAYVDQNLWPVDQADALSDDAVSTSVDFYLEAGNITKKPASNDFLNTSFVS